MCRDLRRLGARAALRLRACSSAGPRELRRAHGRNHHGVVSAQCHSAGRRTASRGAAHAPGPCKIAQPSPRRTHRLALRLVAGGHGGPCPRRRAPAALCDRRVVPGAAGGDCGAGRRALVERSERNGNPCPRTGPRGLGGGHRRRAPSAMVSRGLCDSRRGRTKPGALRSACGGGSVSAPDFPRRARLAFRRRELRCDACVRRVRGRFAVSCARR